MHQNKLTAANEWSRTENYILMWISHVWLTSDPLNEVSVGTDA